MKCGHPSTTEVSLSSNPILVFRGPAAIRRSASASASAFACFRGRGFHFRGPNLVSSHIAFLLGFFLTLLTCIELYITIYTTVYITIIYIYIYIYTYTYLFTCICLRPENRPSVFAFFLRCDILGGDWRGCNNVLCLRYHRFSSVNTLHVTLHTSFVLGRTHFMLRCTRLMYLGEHTSCCVAHRGFSPRLMCTYINIYNVGPPNYKLVCKPH